jgi:hypothetical protein
MKAWRVTRFRHSGRLEIDHAGRVGRAVKLWYEEAAKHRGWENPAPRLFSWPAEQIERRVDTVALESCHFLSALFLPGLFPKAMTFR